MNPVDHVSIIINYNIHSEINGLIYFWYSLTVVVTISISVRPRPSRGMRPRVKRLVSSPPDGPVCCAVRKRPRNEPGDCGSFFSALFSSSISGSFNQEISPMLPRLDIRLVIVQRILSLIFAQALVC